MSTTPGLLQNWFDALSHLSESVQSYLDASLALESAHIQSYALDKKMLDKLLGVIHNERTDAKKRTTELQKALVAVNRVYNRTPDSVPISLLPKDILVDIFAVASVQCHLSMAGRSLCRRNKTLLAISHVCSDWRLISVNASALWTHFDICRPPDIVDQLGIENLWLERAINIPLSACFRLQNSMDLSQLRPFLSRTSSLSFYVNSEDAYYESPKKMLESALKFWIKHGSAGVVRELSYEVPFDHIGLLTSYILRPGFLSLGSLNTTRVEQFLGPLQVLRLYCIPFEWTSIAYHGLTHLELCGVPEDDYPTPQEMAHVLSNCPDLRVLKLALMFQPQTGQPAQPVVLHRLEELDLVGVSNGFSTLFPLIAPGPGELSVRMRIILKPSDVQHIVSFFARSNVTSLNFLVDPMVQVELLSQCLGLFRNLRYLTAEFLPIPIGFTSLFLDTLAALGEAGTAELGDLDTVALKHNLNAFSVRSIERFVKVHRVKTLVLEDGKSQGPSGENLRNRIESLVEHMIVRMDQGSYVSFPDVFF